MQCCLLKGGMKRNINSLCYAAKLLINTLEPFAALMQQPLPHFPFLHPDVFRSSVAAHKVQKFLPTHNKSCSLSFIAHPTTLMYDTCFPQVRVPVCRTGCDASFCTGCRGSRSRSPLRIDNQQSRLWPRPLPAPHRKPGKPLTGFLHMENTRSIGEMISTFFFCSFGGVNSVSGS